MKVIAHRGWSGRFPENTMRSFSEAAGLGVDAIELDVHLSKDGEVMIIHDESLMRTTGESGVVSDYTRSQLERINAKASFGSEFGFTPIPSLEEYLDYISKTDVCTNIELKTAPTYYPGLEEKTIKLVDRFSYSDRVFYSSFNWLSIFKIKLLNPDAKAGALIEALMIENIGYQLGDLGFDSFHPELKLINKERVDECHRYGIDVNVWTVNTKEDMERCRQCGVDGVITNNPDVALSLFRKGPTTF